jgi:hypothetical protein
MLGDGQTFDPDVACGDWAEAANVARAIKADPLVTDGIPEGIIRRLHCIFTSALGERYVRIGQHHGHRRPTHYHRLHVSPPSSGDVQEAAG